VALTQTKLDLSKFGKLAAAQKLAVTVLSGGPSGEREVSLQSGQAVAAALQSRGHQVYLEDINPNNLAALARQVDCVFIALHGAFGEDGQVQTILERRGLAYCGSGPEACALAMNKAAAKQKFLNLSLPTPRFAVARADNLREALAAWSFPLVVKPVKEGSSLNCHIVRDFPNLRPAAQSIVEQYGEALVEEFVDGPELTVAILGDEALPPIEIRTPREFYDYRAKYEDDATQYLFDIDLPAELLDRIQRMSLEAHRGLGCRDFSRVDWRVDARTHEPYLLEVNTIPGLTSHSLVPKAAAKAGIEMADFCECLIGMAIKRKFSRKA
jgi:D-alanine-D-alanine ligase